MADGLTLSGAELDILAAQLAPRITPFIRNAIARAALRVITKIAEGELALGSESLTADRVLELLAAEDPEMFTDLDTELTIGHLQ
ncbi:hypothetical protein SEA_ALEEMILY_40 [Gordonia phage Aleemily]|uniref:Uncharacterized protein n=2 Tax=Cafassovirus TaxID=3425056 RepID=A0A9E7QCU4_9CAUD|nr:hypothetical protein SEA_CAFASSO_41 [Gordonia phage Cafasso]UVK59780.1 hypothetical protein SEA_ALEEMILY_40 [Gordonia phage Aleemily]